MTKIAILSRWNATCGISMHAELLCKEFLNRKYNIVVFAPTIESASKWWHHKIIRKKDEDFVIRCYEEVDPNGKGGKIDEDKILSEDFDVFIVESYASLPYHDIEKLLSKIKKKKKCVTLAVIHEGCGDHIKYRTLNIFDAVVVFDERFIKEVVGNLCSLEKIHIIPYPCIYDEEYVTKRKKEILKDLKKKKDKIVFFSFGRQPPSEYSEYIDVLRVLHEKYNLIYKIVRSNGKLKVEEPWIIQIQDRPDTEKIYNYLENADIHLLPKGKTDYVVVSSTLCQCIASLCPTVAPNTRHFEALPEINGVKPVVLYDNIEDLRNKIEKLIEDQEFRKKVIEAAEIYARENSVKNIADKFEKLFNMLIEESSDKKKFKLSLLLNKK